ncbi:hypothetical protein PG993_007781 [Apiospora rasikravindrae]|uniref:Uncharacterized protein n=1 Tax=Apiospora rasikravindrae TaxID=990691 RepID=A0ABR1SYH0_9PEZI
MSSQEDEQPQGGGKVQLSISLSTSPPHTISVRDPYPSEPLKLVATIEQVASPFPERAVTIMTKYSFLDHSPSGDAFSLLYMKSPQIAVPDAQCPAPELKLRPTKPVTHIRVSGDPDLLKRREEEEGFDFVAVPPVGRGHAEVVWELSPARLVQKLGNAGEPVQEKLLRLLRPGDVYKITPITRLSVSWWTFGSLWDDDEGLSIEKKKEKKKRKVARWTLPDDLPLVREPGMDETGEVAHRLRDLVDLHDVNHLNSRSAVEDEQRPVVKDMRAEGWVFGEPEAGLTMVTAKDQGVAVFTISE